MWELYYNQPPVSSDLYVFNLGSQRCPKNHSFGPAVRRNVLVHYIYEGMGYFESAGNTYKLGPGQAFVIFPHQTTFYKADGENPWHYSWVEIAGSGAQNVFYEMGVTMDNPIISDHPPFKIGRSLRDALDAAAKNGSVYKICSLLWNFVSCVYENQGVQKQNACGKKLYVDRAIEYINANYWRKPNVNEISDYLGIDRGYLNKLFKQYAGKPPQKYMIEHRIGIAIELLTRDDLSVGDVGRSVGFEDSLAFSKAFKKATGQPPSEWRKTRLKKAGMNP